MGDGNQIQRTSEINQSFGRLHVDKPKANGSGSTNDGNTARKAFLNTDTFA